MCRRNHKIYSKAYNVDGFLQILKDNFQTNDILGENASINESMINFKGHSSLKQFLPKKPIKRGFKVWTMVNSKNEYVYDFDIYKERDIASNSALGGHILKGRF